MRLITEGGGIFERGGGLNRGFTAENEIIEPVNEYVSSRSLPFHVFEQHFLMFCDDGYNVLRHELLHCICFL